MRQLARITAQMAGLMCLALIDLGALDAFRGWARTARLAARQAGNPLIHSWVRAEEAYGHYYRGRLWKAIEVAREAQLIPGDVPCVDTVLAAALEAHAHAALASDRHREARAALGRAETILSRLEGEAVGASAFGYNEAQFRFHAGNAYTHLHDTHAAWREQEQALHLYPESDYLDRSLIALDHAYCLAYDGDVAGATTCVEGSLIGFNTEQRQGIITARAREVLGALPVRDQSRSQGSDLQQLLSGPGETKERSFDEDHKRTS